MPSRKIDTGLLTGLLSRFSGKKFVVVAFGVMAVVLITNVYLEWLDESEFMLHRLADVLIAAMYSIAAICGMYSLGQGITDHGRAKAVVDRERIENDLVVVAEKDPK